jgi:hypothetical protein
MNIKAELEQQRGLALAHRIVAYIGDDPERFAPLMECVLHGSPRIAQHASWPMSMVCEAHPELAKPWIADMLHALHEPMHEAVHRSIMRSFQFCELPKRLHGRLTAFVFACIADPGRSIATRVFSITVGVRMVKLYSELADEFGLILENVLRDHPTAAVRSRVEQAHKALKMVPVRT